MLRVLRHYLPLRRALLLFSETALLTATLSVMMAAHLTRPSGVVIRRVIDDGMGPETAQWRCWISAFLVAVLSQFAIAFNELYDFRVSASRYDRAARFVGSAGSAIALAVVTVLLARTWDLQRVLDFPGLTTSQLLRTLVFALLIGFSLLYFWRHLFHASLRRWNFNQRVLVLGAGAQARSLAHVIAEHPDAGYEVVGLVPEGDTHGALRATARENRESRSAAGRDSGAGTRAVTLSDAIETLSEASLAALLLPPLARPESDATRGGEGAARGGEGAARSGASASLLALVQRLGVDVVAVALEDRRGNLPTDDLLRCRLAGIGVRERESIYEQVTGKLAVEAMRPSYLIFNEGFSRSQRADLAKRAADIVLAGIGIVLTWPLMLFTALIVRLDSKGPALFSQERVGLNGARFTLYKFRSMRTDAEKTTGPVWAQKDDPRITRTGRFIRKARLDELPQLFNVLWGHMSLVGPRPERQVFCDDLARQIPYYNQRHIVKPGVTGWAQINYPYGNTVQDALQKLQYDLFYIKNQSLPFDLSILFQTIKTVVLRKGT
ncbi:MAG: TIGR03013 family PEP-CTERM/XrtA system glycosyltransferase [Planctomycetes bacterium]|nr:TIGR03013 family PEP-CTERM/XrtA system glycosyltransferase [Planctomycetota bacterium]